MAIAWVRSTCWVRSSDLGGWRRAAAFMRVRTSGRPTRENLEGAWLAWPPLLWPKLRREGTAGNTMTVEESILSQRGRNGRRERGEGEGEQRRLVGQKMPLPTRSVESERRACAGRPPRGPQLPSPSPTLLGAEEKPHDLNKVFKVASRLPLLCSSGGRTEGQRASSSSYLSSGLEGCKAFYNEPRLLARQGTICSRPLCHF